SGAPTNSPYITKTTDATLSNEFALGTLATGVLKNTTTTGIPTIAVEGTDYYGPSGTDIPVTDGGTGRSTSTTAYGVICAGTTAAGVQQTVASAGTSGQVLTSNGASALPTFQASAAGGDVTASSTLTDNALVRGDGGAKGVQDSGILIDDSDNITAATSIDIGDTILYGSRQITADTGGG
ncbi:MAG: hypothetical protein GY941_09305, partial [Planctomycetes bacterium]|nr:hypothetical protein [Planctomycetota bacterium]